jgi:DNA repair exonuclease SbcCD nuclease subunit
VKHAGSNPALISNKMKNMKQPIGIWVTDTHLTENTIDVNFSIFAQIFKLCNQLGVKQIFHGGDVFTSRKGQLEVVLNAFKSILDQAAEQQIMILAIPGNHDKTSYVSDSSFIDAFNGHAALTVLEAGSALHYDTMNIYFLPYYDENLMYSDKLQEIRAKLSDDECNILFTHVGIDGVKNNGHVNVENDLKQNLFDDFHLVLVGHYHDRQVLGSRDHIVYTGSAYQATFGEDVNKGCAVVYDDGTYEFIDLAFQQHITLDILPQDLDASLMQMIKDKSTEAKIKIKVNDTVGDNGMAMLQSLESNGIRVEIEKTSFKPTDKIGKSQVSFTNDDIIAGYDEFAIDRKIENAEFGKSILMEVLQNVAN